METLAARHPVVFVTIATLVFLGLWSLPFMMYRQMRRDAEERAGDRQVDLDEIAERESPHRD